MKFCPSCNKTYPEGQTFCPEDGEVLQESPESFVGRVIDGKYKIEGFIAQGGMGAVYRARHILFGDEVVIKTLRSEMRNNAEWLKRFQREGKAARAFRHPNSVTVYDLSSDSGGMIYMVMEYVEGHTLDRELKRRGRFTPSEALEVLEPVADVLDAAHARGVVHRDLKPENIMLGSDGRGGTVVKVLDLGIAKLTGVGDLHSTRVTTSLTMAGQILGTPYYMSPEQWGELPRDGNPEVDGRTDVYSLGVIFFELVAGRKPLGGSTLSELRQKHVAAPLPLLGEVAPGVTADFGRAVARAMSKDRADRPRSAGAFVEELRAALGLSPRSPARGLRAGGSESVVTVDAARGAAPSEADTAELARGTGVGDGVTADTILTGGFESPAAGRETDAQRRNNFTSGNARAGREAVRETVVAAGAAQGGASDFGRRTPAGPGRGLQTAGEYEMAERASGVPAAAPMGRRSLAPLAAGGALALLLLAGAGGWLAWRGWPAKPQTPAAETPQPAPPPAVPRVEAASYWFEAFENRNDSSGRHVAELAPALASGKWFKFHFVTRQRGYLYIIGPAADGNAQMTLLTAKGARDLKSNLVGAGADFSFPFGLKKFHLDAKPGAEDFTFIFSPTPLMPGPPHAAPSFLSGENERELTPAEIAEWERFRAQFRQDAPELSVRGEGADRQ
ncbi:MAG TPA: protein kinase, partial [Pyrinomonadaceae bacterium]